MMGIQLSMFAPGHCRNEATWCGTKKRRADDGEANIIAYPGLVLCLPHPDVLHVEYKPGHCGCRCPQCIEANVRADVALESALRKAVAEKFPEHAEASCGA